MLKNYKQINHEPQEELNEMTIYSEGLSTADNSRDIYINEEITRTLATLICRKIREINDYDSVVELKHPDYERTPIFIFIDTYGGEISAGFSIITAISESITPVVGIVTGNCYSMGVTILASCHYRLSTSFADFMLHSANVEFMVGSSEKNYQRQIEKLRNTNLRMKEYLIKRLPDAPKDYFDKIVHEDEDIYFDCDEALKIGLVTNKEYENLTAQIQERQEQELQQSNDKTNNIKWKSKNS